MIGRTFASVSAAALALIAGPAFAGCGTPAAPTSFAAATAGLERKDGLVPVYVDHACGRVFVSLKPSDGHSVYGRFLYQTYLRGGLGSAPVGLDRSVASETKLIAFHRAGDKIVAVLENTDFRAERGSADEAKAVAESFAPSAIWSGPVVASGADGAVLIEVSDFLTQDRFGAVDVLKGAHQGAFHVVPALSFPDAEGVSAFPDNVEFDATVTLESDAPGAEPAGIMPGPHTLTLAEHVSLIRLPALGFKSVEADPRAGAFSSLIADYSAPLDQALTTRLAHRFRLEKTDPSAARSPVKKPIVFYVDRAAPEPVRSALIEGAGWWAKAFDAAGFINAFRVELLPEGISPLDARYNVINWVHRQTRGWSYGMNITDPRTGEIVKGGVLLGSQRMRQDLLIFEGLVGTDKTGTGAPDDPVKPTLARLRQLAAHETGHAIGFEHNFAASAFGDRQSVMDYPPPRVKIDGDRLDLSQAYSPGLGSWDLFAVNWLYADGPDRPARVKAAYDAGLRFVSDPDSRPAESAHPDGALWDDGADSVAELAHVMEVRRLALHRFGTGNLPKGAPVSDLRRRIVPVYLFHRYELAAVVKRVGGVRFGYPVKGDADAAAKVVPAGEQARALSALLGALDPATLELPSSLIDLLSTGSPVTRDKAYDIEVFGDSATPVFDLATASGAVADLIFSDLFHPVRLNRVVDQGARDPAQLGLSRLLNRTFDAVFPERSDGGVRGLIRRREQSRLVARLAVSLQDPRLSPEAAAEVRAALTALGHRLERAKPADAADRAQAETLAAILSDPAKLKALTERETARPSTPPPGMPIGSGSDPL